NAKADSNEQGGHDQARDQRDRQLHPPARTFRRFDAARERVDEIVGLHVVCSWPMSRIKVFRPRWIEILMSDSDKPVASAVSFTLASSSVTMRMAVRCFSGSLSSKVATSRLASLAS